MALCQCIWSGALCVPCEDLADYAATLLDPSADYTEFAQACANHFTKRIPSVVNQILVFMRTHARLIAVHKANDGVFDVSYVRMALADKMQQESKLFIMTSFERGLKHAGFVCIQTTHGGGDTKVFRLDTND